MVGGASPYHSPAGLHAVAELVAPARDDVAVAELLRRATVYVVPAPDPDALRSALRSRLSAYKVPRRIVAVPDDQIPMMSSGKIDARALRQMLSAS